MGAIPYVTDESIALTDGAGGRPLPPARYASSASMSTLAQHGAAIASRSIAGPSAASNGDGWATFVQAALSLAILLALAVLWWRTLRPEPSAERGDWQS
jgi:hypothetical protein